MDSLKNSTHAIILDKIRRSKRIARIDLAQETGISQATVTTITADMIRHGLIEEVARENDGQTRRGRPRIDLRLRASAHLVAGLKVAETTISIILVNFEGAVIYEHKYNRPDVVVSAKRLIEQIQEALNAALANTEYELSDLSALGVGIAGVVDARQGFVHWSPFLEERNLNLGALLSKTMKCPIFMDNDANLVAIAEQYMGTAQGVSNFIVVTIEAGVGMGIVIDNEIYRGARGAGAEFGHTKVQLDGAACRCGQNGCLEAYVADFALLRETAEHHTQLIDANSTEQSLQNLLTAARDGDANAERIVNQSSRIFAMGIANLVNLFDPELIILSGERMTMDHLYAEDVMSEIKASIVQVDAKPPEIVTHKWGDFMWAHGAATFALGGVADISVRKKSDYVA